MTALATIDTYAGLSGDTLTIRRLLPGPIERVFAYLTDSDLRRQWLAAGEMEQRVGAPFTLTWRNDELTDPPGVAPKGFGGEHSMDSRVLDIDPPHRLAFAWNGDGKVTMELQPEGDEVLLTVTHERLPAERSTRLGICAGWHSHLDMLAARTSGSRPPQDFWSLWKSLKQDYESRLPA